MPLMTPLPAGTRALLAQNTHPGLMLDKYVASWDPDAPPGKLSERVQRPAVQRVVELSRSEPPGLDFVSLRKRHDLVLDSAKARRLPAVTAGPLTLHLARASALENAGICLHPVYGFVYLPGSGVKGLVHAFACEEWLPAQDDREAAWRTICEAFGWAPSGWLDDLARRHGVRSPKDAQAGALVFHDAWPDAWPRLVLDLLNNHHASYYQKAEPPGDWDNPVPVYFLAIPAGQSFTFAVSPRRSDAPEKLLTLALDWLKGGLALRGAGAKTATGYGSFTFQEPAAPLPARKQRAEFSCELELVTPAFLAGAAQSAEDCELRPATLRGLLRWWWRTLHAGFVDASTLAQMEASVWGDVSQGGAVRITVVPKGDIRPLKFDKMFLTSRNQLPEPPNRKTTQGLWYHTFGMDDNKREGGEQVRVQRFYVAPPAAWTIQLTARSAEDAALVLDQAKAALALLCRFGGVGSKARKGFGSFADPKELQEFDVETCRARAAEFREKSGLGRPAFNPHIAGSPSLEQALPVLEIPAGWSNYWLALDQTGSAAQSFAQLRKHQLDKKALGLPRNVGSPVTGRFRAGKHVKDRHASPVHFHVGRDAKGLIIRVLALPAAELPDLATSQSLLKDLLVHLNAELPARFVSHAGPGKKPPVNPGAAPAATGAPTVPLLKSGQRVLCVLLVDKTKGGGWKAKHKDSGLAGTIVNTGDVPADKQPGNDVELIVVSDNPKNLSFRYPTAADATKPAKGQSKPPPSQRGGRR